MSSILVRVTNKKPIAATVGFCVSIFRISNSNALVEPTLAIVLDRGGAIKGNKIDLLYESQSSIPNNVTQKDITIDVVRLGW